MVASFKQKQFEFAQLIKTGQSSNHFESRRLAIYQSLFFNNMLDNLSNVFPVLSSLYTQAQWQTLVRQFFTTHQCHSPHFVDISLEFLQFLSHEYQTQSDDPIFVRELAHYEWLELDLSIDTSVAAQSVLNADEAEIRSCASFSLSKLTRLVSYPYPVHQISTDFQPNKPQQTTYLLLYRQSDGIVRFMELNAVSAFSLDLLKQHSCVNFEWLKNEVSQALPQFEQHIIEQGLLSQIIQLAQLKLIVPE